MRPSTLCYLCGLGLLLANCEKSPPLAPAPPADSPRAVAGGENSGAAFGKIMDLGIGSSIQEARAKLDPLRVPVVYTPDEKERIGKRIYWKLQGTDYDWIMIWGNAAGTITRMRAVFRPDRTRPFSEIGDLKAATTVTATAAKWNLRTPAGSNFRMIAQGAEGRATTVYMFVLEAITEHAVPRDIESEDEE